MLKKVHTRPTKIVYEGLTRFLCGESETSYLLVSLSPGYIQNIGLFMIIITIYDSARCIIVGFTLERN